MYAEAANELGQNKRGPAETRMGRARARNGNNSILLPVTTTDQAQLRLAIQHERRIELAMEHEHFLIWSGGELHQMYSMQQAK